MAVKALETSLVPSENERRRKEYTDRGVGTTRDGYLQRQILKRGSSGCVRPMVKCVAYLKREERSKEAKNEEQTGEKQCVIARG